MMKYDTDRPSPVPWPTSLVVKEGFENPFAHVLRHAYAVIFNLYLRPRRVELGAQDDASRFALVGTLVNRLGGVFQQVQQHLFKVRWE